MDGRHVHRDVASRAQGYAGAGNSFPLFFACDYRTVVAPLPQFATPEATAKYPPLAAGDHLFAQTAQSFTYLKQRLERGELVLPDGSKMLASFGQQARYAAAEPDGASTPG